MALHMTIFLDQFEAEKAAAIEAMRLKTIEECIKVAERVAGIEVDGPEHDIGWHAGCWAIADAIAALKDTKS